MTSLQDDALERLKCARARKADVQADLEEAYFFAAHWRPRSVLSDSDPGKSRNKGLNNSEDAPATDLLAEVSGDFVSNIMDTFMPKFVDWAKRGRGMMTSIDDFKSVKRQVEDDDKQIMAAIRASGFYAASYQAFNPDLFVGTAAMWIDPAQVIFKYPACWGVPIRSLEVNVGALNTIDDRFAVLYMTYAEAKKLLGTEAKIPTSTQTTYNDTKRCQVVLGFWDISDTSGEQKWQHVALLDKQLVNEMELTGEGSCPLIPFRWEPDNVSAWGTGPGIKTLPSSRVLDAMTEVTQNMAEFAAKPPFGYPSDGVLNFDGGLMPGQAYPMLPGSGKDIAKLFLDGKADAGFYTIEQIEQRIRRLSYTDFPEQPGKTPPTEAQWLDQMIKSQRRIGPPGEMFWREGPREVFLRFQYILEQAGIIKKITRPGAKEGELVSLEPFNPAVRALALQQVEQAVKVAQIARIVAPQEAEVAIDGLKSIGNIMDVLDERVLVMRSEGDIKGAIAMIAQLSGQGGEAGPPGTPPNGAGAAVPNGAAQMQ